MLGEIVPLARRLTTVVLTILLATATVPLSAGMVSGLPSATVSMAGQTDSGTTSTASQNATVVDSCRVITEPGRYELTTDLESNSTCISIAASNVTFDGNGHTISAAGTPSEPGLVTGQENVTVTNVSLVGWNQGIHLEQTRNVTIKNSRFDNSSLDAFGVHDLVVANTSLDHSTIHFTYVVNSLVTGIDGDHGEVIVTESIDSTIRDSALHQVTYDESVGVTIANNTPDDSGSFGIRLGFMADGRNQIVVTNNTITGNTGGINDGVGVRVTWVHNLSITNNRIVGNDVGIRIASVKAWHCIPGRVEVHRNSLANNTEYGIEYGGSGVNATHNYWGASNGPSSATSHPLEDPKTGTLANGDGSAVPADPENQNVSSVRFDPWLEQDPTTGTENESV